MKEKMRAPLVRKRFSIVLSRFRVLGALTIAPALISANVGCANAASATGARPTAKQAVTAANAPAAKTEAKAAAKKPVRRKLPAKKAIMTRGTLAEPLSSLCSKRMIVASFV